MNSAKCSNEELNELITTLYQEHPCGGPLHIITDDNNVRDSDVVFCYAFLHGNVYTARTRALCNEILHQLLLRTERERRAYLGFVEAAVGCAR